MVVPSDGRTTSRATAFRRRSPSSTDNVSSPLGRPRGSSPERPSRAAQVTRNVTRPPMISTFVNPIWYNSRWYQNPATRTREIRNRNPERTRNVGRRASIRSPDRPRDLEPPVLEEEGVVVAVLVHAPHLHALDAALERGLGDGLEAKMDDPVREELFLQRGRRPLERGFLRDQQARDAQVPQPLEEAKRLRPTIRELEDEFEGVPRIDREEPEAPLHAELEDLCLQDREERFASRSAR